MASCKECVHVEVCKEYVVGLAAVRGVDLNMDEMDELEAVLQCDDCENFKDRSRLLDLPCKVGDTIYRVKDGKVTKEQVVEFGISSRGVVLYRTLGYELGYSDYFGNSLFFSKEEAEQALKERESSD